MDRYLTDKAWTEYCSLYSPIRASHDGHARANTQVRLRGGHSVWIDPSGGAGGARGADFAVVAAVELRGADVRAALHRVHHRHSDGEADIHSPGRRGFWWSHAGWVLPNEHMSILCTPARRSRRKPVGARSAARIGRTTAAPTGCTVHEDGLNSALRVARALGVEC